MKTTLHTYSYDTNDRKTWASLPQWARGDAVIFEAILQKTPGRGHKMHSLKPKGDRDYTTQEIILEPEHLFQNQWNSNIGRVFDWYEEAVFDGRGNKCKNIKRGHYLDITDEMLAIRRDTLKCGYTGQMYPASCGQVFNISQQAIGSPYLKESELHLLRLMPACDEWVKTRPQLTEKEKAYLLPLYLEAQMKANQKLRDKQREEIHKDFDKAQKLAHKERDGFIWLLDHGLQIENVIFYNHTCTFSFGWRSPYTGKAREVLLEALKKFPFTYDVK